MSNSEELLARGALARLDVEAGRDKVAELGGPLIGLKWRDPIDDNEAEGD